MSDSASPGTDPDSPRPAGEASRVTRRRATPTMVAFALLLAVLITAVGFILVGLVIWAVALAVR